MIFFVKHRTKIGRHTKQCIYLLSFASLCDCYLSKRAALQKSFSLTIILLFEERINHLLHSSFFNFFPSINISQSALYFFHFMLKCVVYRLEIKSTTVDETIMCWKLHPPRWKCFKKNECSIFHEKWKKYGIKREKTSLNWKNNRWRNNSTAWIGFLRCEWQIKSREKKN